MDLGKFSISLAVKDLQASSAFYGALGFEPFDGNAEEGWLMLRAGNGATIGLFQGMFESNILTFNPADLEAIEAGLASAGIAAERSGDPASGIAYLTLSDPDGNQILIDRLPPDAA